MGSVDEFVDGRFRIERIIGRGGMGAVYRALDERTGERVALKLLEGRSSIEIDRAHREAEVLATLAHPAIVGHVADGITSDNKLYIAMEWVDGVTVGQRLAAAGLTLREAVAIAKRVASALAAAHGAGIVHRDIKPSNVLLENDDPERAKLIDFGIARVSDAVKALTRTGITLGTPGYMSPEQARGARAVTSASDVFGLGCLLYECAAALPAFSGTQAAAVMVKILLTEPIPLVNHCPEAPLGLQLLVERMLRKDASTRIPDCEAVVRELSALGDMPDGPRRNERGLTSTTAVGPAVQPRSPAHCLVVAAKGQLDDALAPPSADQCRALVAAADEWYASIEILATGAVAAHFEGAPVDAARRAASCALAIRAILPEWSIAVSAPADAVRGADTSTTLLSKSVLANIFNTPDGPLPITVDREAASLLSDEFELEIDGDSAKLLRRRTQK